MEIRKYGPEKQYFQKEEIMQEVETKYFNYIRKHLKKNYIITPKVILKTLINIRPDYLSDATLNTAVDFAVFSKKKYKPLLLINIITTENKEQQKSVEDLLKEVDLPMISHRPQEILNDFGEVKNKKLLKEIYEAIKLDQQKKHITKKTEFLFKGLEIRNGKLFITLSTYNFNGFYTTLKIGKFSINKDTSRTCRRIQSFAARDANGASVNSKKMSLILKPFSKGLIELEFENLPVSNGNKIYYESVPIALVHDV